MWKFLKITSQAVVFQKVNERLQVMQKMRKVIQTFKGLLRSFDLNSQTLGFCLDLTSQQFSFIKNYALVNQPIKAGNSSASWWVCKGQVSWRFIHDYSDCPYCSCPDHGSFHESEESWLTIREDVLITKRLFSFRSCVSSTAT